MATLYSNIQNFFSYYNNKKDLKYCSRSINNTNDSIRSVLEMKEETQEVFEEKFEFKETLTNYNIQELTVDNTLYHQIKLEGYESVSEIGSPDLPVKKYNVAVPQGSTINLNYNINQVEEVKACNIYPVQYSDLDADVNYDFINTK